MPNPAVVVDFVANTKDLSKGFDDASRKAGRFGGKVKGIGLAGAAAGFTALAGAVKLGVDEFGEAQKVGAQTDAVLKSTGDVAKVSAGHISDLAESLMKKSGVDDEAIQSGENVLLTFTNIRNEAGKGKDIFDQSTKAALDMSVAMGTDMATASKQVGKALQDPVKGMGKLSKAGVTFTDAQKKQAEAMVKTGDVAGAQKIILGELTKEFGGSAEAAGKTVPGQLSILKESFSNLAGDLIGKLVPPLTTFTDFLVAHKTTVTVFAAVLGALALAFVGVTVATALWSAAQTVITATTTAWAAAQWLINAALAANPIALVVIAIVALVAILVIAWKNSETFRDIVTGAFNAVWDAIKAVFGWLRDNWPTILAILTGPIGLAVLAIVKHWDEIKQAISDALEKIKGWITAAWDWVRDTTVKLWDGIKGVITGAWEAIKQAFSKALEWVKGFIAGAWTREITGLANIWHVITDGATKMWGAVKDVFNGMLSWFGGIVGKIKGIAGDVANAIKGPINSVVDAWNKFAIPRFEINIPKIRIAGKTLFGGGSFGFGPFDFPDIPRLARGGIVDRPTLALIGEAGPEAVVPLSDAQRPSVQVRVFIGDRELTDLVRTEITDANTGLARTLLAG